MIQPENLVPPKASLQGIYKNVEDCRFVVDGTITSALFSSIVRTEKVKWNHESMFTGKVGDVPSHY